MIFKRFACQFGRFLANRAVTTHEMPVTAGRQANRRAKGRHVLAIMDTTDVLFPTQGTNKRGFGMGSDGAHPGLFLCIRFWRSTPRTAVSSASRTASC